MKFALFSAWLPPSHSGQSMMLYRLLSGIDPAEYCLVTRSFRGLTSTDPTYTERLPVAYHSLEDSLLTRDPLWLRRLKTFGRLFSRIRRTVKILREENCKAVVVCSGDLLDLVAGFIASRRQGLSFYVYVFDDYVHIYPSSYRARRLLARCCEFICVRGAAGVVVINEFLRNEMRRRLGPIETVIIPNPGSPSFPPAGRFRPIPLGGEEIRIVYTGTIYEAHYDAFRNLVAALRRLAHRNIKLHLYTAIEPHILIGEGIEGPVVYHAHQPLAAMPGIQQGADLLFLPLAFESPYSGLIKTSSPSKMGDYLAAGRPVIVHSPPDCFLTWYFRQHRCGIVVDEPDAVKLAAAIEQVLENPRLQEDLGAQGRRCVERDCDVVQARNRFAGLLQVRLVDRPLP